MTASRVRLVPLASFVEVDLLRLRASVALAAGEAVARVSAVVWLRAAP